MYRVLIELTNGKWSSILIKKFAQANISKYIIPSFVKVYKINKEEMERNIDDFENLHEFFIRRLKPGKRTVAGMIDEVSSPVDAVIEDVGFIQPDKTIVVKGKTYSIEEMLGGEKEVEKYIDGTYLIFYLSPSDYHRIHSPVSGEIVRQWTIGTKSYPVNKYGLKYGKHPLSKNYRTITELKTDQNDSICMVKVGAMFINSIVLNHESAFLEKGQEMAYFSFGSTVILLFEKDRFVIKDFSSTPYPVKIGEVIGEFTEVDRTEAL